MHNGFLWLLVPYRRLFLCLTGVIFLSLGVANSSDWPQFRGPNHDSISTEQGLADSWPEAGPPVLWTRELGQGYSSFAAVENRVYTLVQSLYRQSVVCLDAQSGDTVWTYEYDWPFDGGGLYPGPRSTPTWHAGRLYFATPNGMIGCLRADTGHLVWSRNPKKEHHGRGTDFGYAASPVVVDGHVIVSVGGLDACVVALDARDGSTVWAAGDSPASYATPLPITWRGRSFAIVPLENSIAAFDLTAGKQVWEVEFSSGYDEHSTAPLYREPFLCFASPFQAGAKCFRLDDDGQVRIEERKPDVDRDQSESAAIPPQQRVEPGKPVVVWETHLLSNDVSSSVLVDGRIYGFDLKDAQSRLDRPSRGEFRCLDFETGRVIWSTKVVGQASIIVADQKLILFNDRGELILAHLGTDEYAELARAQVFRDEVCWTSAALHNGCIYVRTQTRAACLFLGQEPYKTNPKFRTVHDIPRGRLLGVKWLIGSEREFPATVPDLNEFRAWYLWSLGGLVVATAVALITVGLANSLRWLRQSHRVVRPDVVDTTPDSQAIISSASSTNKESRSFAGLGRVSFWLTAMIAGAIGSPLINSRQSDYVLLWPLALWAAFQITINVITWTERQPGRRYLRWISRAVGILFIGICFLYFALCRSLGYAIEWSFLIGFLPAFAACTLAARFLTTRQRFWILLDLAISSLSFSAYFWCSVAFVKWKLSVGS